jgi:excisionase family DNA binding protein
VLWTTTSRTRTLLDMTISPMQMTLKPVALLRIQEVQLRVGQGRTRVFDLIREGELEAVRLGPRTTRVPSDSVDAYIARVREAAKAGSRSPSRPT